jgi:hypothetical protein
VSTARRIRWVLLLAVLVSAVAWLVRSIVGLSRSANNYGNRVIKAEWSTSRPSAALEHTLRASQDDWGRSTMIAVAAIAATLIIMFIHAFLHDPRSELPR